MSDAVTALDGARYDGAVVVEDAGPRGMITLRGDLSDAAFRDDVSQTIGADMPETLRASEDGERAILWMSPDEVLILCPYADVADRLTALQQALAGHHHLAADVSDARSVIRLSGAGIADVLSKLTPADMSPAKFAPGTVRRTRLAQIPAALWRRGDDVTEVFCFRSVSRYAFDLLRTAAAPEARLDFLDRPD